VTQLHGNRHAWTLKLLSRVTQSLHADNKPDEAEPFARSLVASSRLMLGEDDRFVRQSRLLLDEVLEQRSRQGGRPAAPQPIERST
jgi:hypothetical protein